MPLQFLIVLMREDVQPDTLQSDPTLPVCLWVQTPGNNKSDPYGYFEQHGVRFVDV